MLDVLILKVEEGVTLPFFDASGRKLMERDRLNLRDQRHHEDDLVNSILENGVVPSVRGAPWARYGPDKLALMITWGSLSSATYEACVWQCQRLSCEVR